MRLCLAGRNLKEYSDVMSLGGVEGDGRVWERLFLESWDEGREGRGERFISGRQIGFGVERQTCV